MNFVADTVAGFVQVAKSDRSVGEVINVGSGVEYSIGEIANKIINILQSDSVIESDDQRVRPGKSEVERLLCCNAKAAELLGWKPQVNLDKGLEITIAWLKDNLNRYKANIYNL